MTEKTKSSDLDTLRQNLCAVTPLETRAWSAAEKRFALRRINTGEHLFQAGEVVVNLFFLISGLVRFYYADSKGREFNKSFAGAGHVLSSMASLSTGAASPFSVQALIPTVCFTMGYANYLQLAAQYPEWSHLRIILLERLIIKREQREADLLLLSATERYNKFLQEYPSLAEAIPNYHIASYLGITEVALSRIRGQLGLT